MTAEGAVLAGVDEIHHAYFLFPTLLSDKLADHPEPLQLLLREAPWMDLLFQQLRDGTAVVDAQDGVAEQARGRQDRELGPGRTFPEAEGRH